MTLCYKLDLSEYHQLFKRGTENGCYSASKKSQERTFCRRLILRTDRDNISRANHLPKQSIWKYRGETLITPI
jgi:hypothetical protein